MSNLEGKVALVVDDEPAQCEFITAILDDYKMKTVSASNGIEAMKRLNETKPDLIFLDLLMPEQSGLKFFNELKKKEDYNAIPVIVVSGASAVTGVELKSIIYDKNLKERKRKVLGIDDTPDAYLEKPVDPEKLVETVRECLSG